MLVHELVRQLGRLHPDYDLNAVFMYVRADDIEETVHDGDILQIAGVGTEGNSQYLIVKLIEE